MGFNTTNLTTYIAPASELLRSAILFSDDYSRFDMMVGVSHKEYLNYIETNPYIQAGNCSLGSSGSTIFDEKEIEVVKLAWRDSWCIDDLDKYDMQFGVGTLNGNMSADLSTKLITDETEKIKSTIDKLIFQGSISGGDLMNGFITEMVADSDVIDLGDSTGATIDTIDNIVNDLINAVPENVEALRGALVVHMSIANFRLYKANRISANLFWDNPAHKGINTMDVFGYDNVKVVAEPGMTGDNDHLFISWDKNFILATDELKEIARAKVYFDENTDLVKYKSSMKLGASYKFGNEIVLYSKA